MARLDNFSDDVIVSKQVAKIANMGQEGSKTITQMVVLPNATQALPLSPLCGFVMATNGNLQFDENLLSSTSMFRGRAICKVLDGGALATQGDEKEAKKVIIHPNAFYQNAKDAFGYGLENFLPKTDFPSAMMIKIAPSKGVQNSSMLAEDVATGDVWAIVEASAYPSSQEDIEELNKLFSGQHTVRSVAASTLYQRYYRSVRRYRELVVRRLAELVFKQFYRNEDEAPKAPSDRVHHYETNLIRVTNSGEFLIFSEAFDGEEGGLIYAGPYHDVLWVNHDQDKAIMQKIHAAGMLDALPYDTPTRTLRFDALEHIIMKRTRSEANQSASYESDDEEVDETQRTAIAPRKEYVRDDMLKLLVVTAKSIPRDAAKSDKKALRLATQYKAQDLKSTLVWPEPPTRLPVAVPDELINFHMPVEEVPSLKVMGIDLTNASHIPLRVMIQCISPVSTLDQLMIWRAAHSAQQRMSKQ